MPTIKILQYRADKQDGHFLDDAIAWWSGIFNPKTPPHSHSELCFSTGVCFSSTTRGFATGTRFEMYDVVVRNMRRWDIYSKDISIEGQQKMLNRAIAINDRPYNYIGLILDFFLPFGLLGGLIGGSMKRWYCSQAVYYCLTGKRRRISPKRLTKWILKIGFRKE